MEKRKKYLNSDKSDVNGTRSDQHTSVVSGNSSGVARGVCYQAKSTQNSFITPPTDTNGRNGSQPEQATGSADPPNPNLTIATISQEEAVVRKKWTIDQYKEVMWAYYYAIETNMEAPKTKGTFMIWRQRNPDLYPDMDPKKLNNQRNHILKKNGLSNTQLQKIKEDVLQQIHKETEINNTLAPSQKTQDNNTDDNSRIETDTTRTEQQQVQISEDDTIKEMEIKIMAKLLENEFVPIGERRKLKRPRNTKKLDGDIEAANAALSRLIKGKKLNITEINNYIYATAAVIAGEVAVRPSRHKEELPWKTRLRLKIEQDRKYLSVLQELNLGVASKGIHKKISDLLQQQHITYKQLKLKSLTQNIKMRLQARAQRLRRYQNRSQQFTQNKMFKENTRMFYRQLNKQQDTICQIPSQQEIEKFWTGILEEKKTHNKHAHWIKYEYDCNSKIEPIIWTEIELSDLMKVIKRSHNWKAPGPDMVQNYWIKNLTALHNSLLDAINEVLNDPKTIPEWLTSGITFLIFKGKDSKNPKNYRPITCLPTMYKLITAIISDKLYEHLMLNRILPPEQKGCRKGARGCKDQLLVSKMIIEDAKKRKKTLSMAWVDYKKAFDSVPHSWILDALKIYRVSPRIVKFVGESMTKWQTKITLTHQSQTIKTRNIAINRGIFQGDSLSPLLFCLSLIPLSSMLNRERYGYEIAGGKVNHLFYMDDLKTFARNRSEQERIMHVVKTFSDDIEMEFGIEKCATVTLKGGKFTQRNNLQLDDNSIIKNLDQYETYKYLGVDENADIQHDQMKAKVKKEYYRRTRLILSSKLNSKNKINAINTLAIPVPSYSFGILNWKRDEIQEMDRRTRKLLTMHGMHHPRADADRIYIKRKNGGRGLIELQDAYETAVVGLGSYIEKGNDSLMKLVRAHETNKAKYSVIDACKNVRIRLGIQGEIQNLQNVKENLQKEKINRVKNKPMHGQFLHHLDKPFVDKNLSLAWLNSPDLKGETESLLIAAQDQALNTKYHQRKITKTSNDSLCRMCNMREETIGHILSGCTTLAATEYTHRHNRVASYIHWTMCKELGNEVATKYYNHKPEPVLEIENCTLLWDFPIITDREIGANRPDIVLHNRAERTCLLIDIAIPDDNNITVKEAEKISKYKDLQIEIQRMWNVKAKVIPLVIGSLGTVKKGCHTYFQQIPGKPSIPEVQKIALLGSAHILRRIIT